MEGIFSSMFGRWPELPNERKLRIIWLLLAWFVVFLAGLAGVIFSDDIFKWPGNVMFLGGFICMIIAVGATSIVWVHYYVGWDGRE